MFCEFVQHIKLTQLDFHIDTFTFYFEILKCFLNIKFKCKSIKCIFCELLIEQKKLTGPADVAFQINEVVKINLTSSFENPTSFLIILGWIRKYRWPSLWFCSFTFHWLKKVPVTTGKMRRVSEEDI